VVGIPLFTDNGSGEINTATIHVKAPYGKYITSTSPKPLDEFDRISIALDDRSGNSYLRFFEIQKLIPTSDKDTGTILEIDCIGIEYHTQMAHFSKQFWFSSAARPAEIVGDTYNDNKGTAQPTLNNISRTSGYNPNTGVGNGLPTFTQGIYDYGVSPAYCYDVWMDLIDRQIDPAGGGGVRDFFELGFDTPSVNVLDFRGFISGSSPESKTSNNTPVTIETTTTINPSETEGDIENATGTISYVMGDPRAGALQRGREIYNSGLFQFIYRPEWNVAISYNVSALIKYKGKHYISLIANNLGNTPPFTAATGPTSCTADGNSNWLQVDMGDRFGDTNQYSEWTDDKVAVILNGMCKPDATVVASGVYTSTGAGAFDGNIVINAHGFFRTWVSDRAVGSGGTPSQGLSASYEYADAIGSINFPRGYRFLNVGTGIFASGHVDVNGVSVENSVIEVVENPDPNKDDTVYQVKYQLDSTTDKMQIVVFRENKMFQWNNSTTDFTDITTEDLGADCLHPFTTMKNTTSFDPKPSETNCQKFPDVTKAAGTFAKNIDSAIEIVYDFNSVINDRLTNQAAYQTHGAWFNMQFPYPVSTFNSITEGVGDIYGGGVNSATDGINEPATLDISNMGYTPSGKLGYNQTDSTRLSKLVTFSFALGLKIEGRNPLNGTLSTVDGTANIRVLMGDTNDNVWSFDFELITTDGTMYPIDTEISAYNTIRNNKPRFFTLKDLADLLNPKEIDNQNIFESRNIKWIAIQHQDQYDEFGRYAPEGNLNDLSNTSLNAAFGGKITLTIDDLHFKKALVVNSGQASTRNLEPDIIQRQDIMLFDQANEVAISNFLIEQHRHKEFDTATTGSSLFDIRFGDSYFLKNTRLVNDADKNEPPADAWVTATEYEVGDKVTEATIKYQCIKDHTSGAANKPPNAEFWVVLPNKVPNTIKLVAKKIEYSISRPAAGRGGVERRIKGVERVP